VVPGGERDVRFFAVEMQYAVTDTQSADARVDTLRVSVVGRDGALLSTGKLRGSITRLFADFGGGVEWTAGTLSENPVVLTAAGGTTPRIAPGATTTFVVGVDVARSPAVEEVRLAIDASGFNVNVAGQRLGVVDLRDAQPLLAPVESGSLVLLASGFEEYAHNYPNPFHAGSEETRIAYVLTRPSRVDVRIFSITGERVWEESVPETDPRASAGAHEIRWDGRNLEGTVVRNGLYVCVISAQGQSARIRIAVAK